MVEEDVGNREHFNKNGDKNNTSATEMWHYGRTSEAGVRREKSYLQRMQIASRLHPLPGWRELLRPILVLYKFPQIL